MEWKRPDWFDTFVIFIKGICMGSADIVPGVSGGTVALIVGIYERFIEAIRSIDFKFVPYFFKGLTDRTYMDWAKKDILRVDWGLLIPLMAGIAFAFLTLANVVDFFLEGFPAYTYAFFFGLIISSALLIWRSEGLKPMAVVFIAAFIGAAFAYWISGLSEFTAAHTLPIVFVTGMISFCAMILPGLSGAFLLLLMGQYEFLLGVLSDMTHLDFSGIWFAVLYLIGGVVGLVLFSRVLSYLLKKHHMLTMGFILGLMLGALRKPWTVMMDGSGPVGFIAIAVGLGVLVVIVLEYAVLSFKGEGKSER